MSSEAEIELARALLQVAQAIEKNTRVMELFIEVVPATKEAELLGVSEKTIRRRRKARKMERLAATA